MFDDGGGSERASGDGGQSAGHAFDECLPELLALGAHDHGVGGCEEGGQLVLRLPAGKEYVWRPQSCCDQGWMLVLPFAGMAADQHESSRCCEALLCAGEGADQQIESLHRSKASDVEQHGARCERRDGSLAVACASRRLVGKPALGLLHERASPEVVAISRSRAKQLDVDAVGQRDESFTFDSQQRHRALDTRGRDDETHAAVRPSAHPLGPTLGMPPLGWRAGGDLLKHQQLSAMELANDRHAWRDVRGGFVERREMVQVQHVGLARAGTPELARPGPHVALVVEVVEHREDAVGGARTVLERWVQRGTAEGALEPQRRAARERRVKFDRVHITVEGFRVTMNAEIAARTGDERYRAALRA